MKSKISKNVFLKDKPIKGKKEDLLNRLDAANEIRDLIKKHLDCENNCEDGSITIGIESSWGNGKTSFVNLIKENFKSESSEFKKFVIKIKEQFESYLFIKIIIFVTYFLWNEIFSFFLNPLISLCKKMKIQKKSKNNKIKFLTFNPWICDNFFNLKKAFFEIIQVNYGKNIKEKMKKIYEGTSVSVSLAFLTITKKIEFKNKTLIEEKKDIVSLLKQEKKKMIIYIDDIDRLDKEEVWLIIRLMKFLECMPYIVFLITYDRNQLLKKLGEKSQYIEKIIPVNYVLPKIEKHDLILFLKTELNKILKTSLNDLCKKDGRTAELFGYLIFLFKNLREIKRYINILKISLKEIKEIEVNIIDFLCIEAIKSIEIDKYNLIYDNMEIITERKGLIYPFYFGKKNFKNQSELIEYIQRETKNTLLKRHIGDILRKLFPWKPDEYSERSFYKDLRICLPKYFFRYFSFKIDSSLFSETEKREILKKINANKFNKSSFYKKMNSWEEKKFLDFLGRIESIEKLNSKQIESLIKISLAGNCQRTRDFAWEKLKYFSNIDFSTRETVFKLLVKIKKSERKRIFKKIINETPMNFPLFCILSKFWKSEYLSIKEIILEKKEINELKTYLYSKYKKFIDFGFEIKTNKLIALLTLWEEIEKIEEIEKYLILKLKEKDNLIYFLEIFFIKKSPFSKKEFDVEGVEKFISLEKINSIVKQLDKDKLTESDKEILQVYLKKKNKKILRLNLKN